MAFPNKSTENIYMERENILFANKLLHTRLADCHQACCAIWQTKIGREKKPIKSARQPSEPKKWVTICIYQNWRGVQGLQAENFPPNRILIICQYILMTFYHNALWLIWCSWRITYIQNLHCMSEHFFFLSAILWLIWRSCRIGCTKSYLQARTTIIGGIAFASATLYLHLHL